jgi:2-oxoglutarate ferredoxin oxidoreductase subunit alpha
MSAKVPMVDKEAIIKGADKVNDFSITVATINGSGSQTSNLTILRALFKMGIPVSGKNLFPSNIQGMPTWYTIRVNKDGYTARRDEHEIVVAMNTETFQRDLNDVLPGGVFYYADDIPLAINREDISIYPMPVNQLVREADVPNNLRNYIANMVYVGVLARMIGIELDSIHQALDFHFKGKEKPIELNFSMVKKAYEWATENLTKIDPYRLERMNATRGQIMTDGNTAAALGAVYGGVHFVSWYPITPSSSLAESLQTYLPQLRKDPETGKNTFAVVQAEDELAAIGMSIGAGWAGLRAMTATSGPGLSLMTEYLGLAYFAEVPVVLWDVQRAGPSTGLPTRTSQGDLLFAHFIGHGDTEMILLLPGSITECFDFGWQAFDLAERLQTPILVLSDLDFGMNQWMSEPFQYPNKHMDRGKVLWEEDLKKLTVPWSRYKDVDNDAIPFRTVIGNKYPTAAYFARGTGHDEKADYSEEPGDWTNLLQRLKKKYQHAKSYVPGPVIDVQPHRDARIGIISFGSTGPAIEEARTMLAKSGFRTDFMRIRSIPFTEDVRDFIKQHVKNYVVELNRDGQMHKLLILDFPELAKSMISCAYIDGLPLTASRVYNFVYEQSEVGDE